MSVRHIDYLKLSSSKFLPVEIRPIRCLLDMPSGTIRTAKWMTHDHWKELRVLICEIANEYEEEKQLNRVTQDVKCNEHKLKNGLLLKIGYMFVPYSSCRCNFLVPREDATWTDDEDDDDDDTQELKDKGGRYSSITPSGEMLVVSVRLQDQKPLSSSRKPAVPASPATADKLLVKALDRSFVVTNTISDYFSSSQKDVASSLLPLSSTENSDMNKLLTLKNIVGKSCQRDHKRVNDLGVSENKRPRRRQVESVCKTSEESVVDSVTLNHRYIHEKLSLVQENEVSIKTDANECDGENLMAGNGLVNTESNRAYFYLKHEDSDISLGEEQFESEGLYFDVHDQDFSCNLPNTQERCTLESDDSQVHMTENSEGTDHNFFERETLTELNSHSTWNSDSLPLADDTFIVERLKEEPEDCMNSYNRGNSNKKQDTLSYVKKNDETDFYSFSKQYVTVSEPQEYFSSSCTSVNFSQVQCNNSCTEDQFIYDDRESSIESEAEIKRFFKTRVNHASSSSSQVIVHNVNAGEDSDEAGEMDKGSDQNEVTLPQETSSPSNESFPVKIPRNFLEHEMLASSKKEMSSPSKNRGRPSRSRVLELFGENGDSNYASERDVKSVFKWGINTQEEEYIPQPLVNHSDSQSTCSDYSPNSLGCRRSMRIQSRDQIVLDKQNTSSVDITSENNKYSRVVSKRTSKEKKGKDHSKTLKKLESSNELFTKVNKNSGEILPLKKTPSMASDVNKRDNSSEYELEFKPDSKAKKLKTICKKKKENVKQCYSEKRYQESAFNVSQISDVFELDHDPEFRSGKEKNTSQNIKGRKKPLHEKKNGSEELCDGQPRATTSKGKRQSCQSYKSAVQNSKKEKQARKILREMEKDIKAGRKQLGKDIYSDSSAVGERVNKSCGQRKTSNRKIKKYLVPANQPTLEDCLFAKGLSGTSSKGRPRGSEEESLLDSVLADSFNGLGDSFPSKHHCDSEKLLETPMTVSDLLRAEERDKQLLGIDKDYDWEDLPDFSNPSSFHTRNPSESSGSSTSVKRQPAQKEKNCQLNEEVTEEVVPVEKKSQKVSQMLINSCHNKICNMSDKELCNRLEENSDFFQGIIDGRLPNNLHKMFQENSCRNRFSEEIFWPFSEEQIEFTYLFLKENYTAKLTQAKCHDISNYIWRVLSPSFFIKVVMDMESIDRETTVSLLRLLPQPL